MKAIITKYHGPTNTKPARISASDNDGNRVMVSYDHGHPNPHAVAVRALMEKMNWTGTYYAGSIANAGYCWVCVDGDEREEFTKVTNR